MKPTIGRIVHYSPKHSPDQDGLDTFAALVTSADGTLVDLAVFPPGTDMFTISAVPFSETPAPGSWTWPPRV